MSSYRKPLTERLVTMLPGLLLGAAAGIAGGAWAAATMDATPYGTTDLNTIARQSKQAGSAAGFEQARTAAARTTAALKASSGQRIDDLERQLSEANRSVTSLEEQSAKQEKQSAKQKERLVRVQGVLAETTAALANASRPSTGTAAGQDVEGVLETTWVLRNDTKPWPKDCSQPLQSYGIRVTAGAGATVAEGRLVRVTKTRRLERRNVLTLTCSMTYTASLPTPLGSGYEVVVTEGSKDEEPLQSEKASSAALTGGSAPTLTVSR